MKAQGMWVGRCAGCADVLPDVVGVLQPCFGACTCLWYVCRSCVEAGVKAQGMGVGRCAGCADVLPGGVGTVAFTITTIFSLYMHLYTGWEGGNTAS